LHLLQQQQQDSSDSDDSFEPLDSSSFGSFGIASPSDLADLYGIISDRFWWFLIKDTGNPLLSFIKMSNATKAVITNIKIKFLFILTFCLKIIF